MKPLIKKPNLKKLFFLILSFLYLTSSNNLLLLANEKRERKEAIQQEYLSSELQNNEYIIGPGDKLKITVFDFDELSGIYLILNDGRISMPFNETIFLQGLTLNQAQNNIKKILSKELISPQVQVSLEQPRNIMVSLTGEVKKPGTYLFKIEKNMVDFPTVVKAIQKAGGLKPQSDLTNISVKRRVPFNQENLKYKIASINLLDLITKGDQDQNLFLFDGDVINIKKRELSQNGNYPALISNLSVDSIQVIIGGEVENPGYLNLPNGTTLNEAILAAGGLKLNRSNSKITLLSMDNEGKVNREIIKINLSKPTQGQSNPTLSNKDIIIVNKNNFSKVLDPIGFANRPVDTLIRYFTLFKLIREN